MQEKKPKERGVFLPTPVSTRCISEEVALWYKEAEAVVVQQHNTKQYHCYSSQQRAVIGAYAAQHGPTPGLRHFTELLGHLVPESTARNYRGLCCKELNSNRK